MNGKGELVEVQGTGERVSFSRATLNEMLDMAQAVLDEISESYRVDELKFLIDQLERRV